MNPSSDAGAGDTIVQEITIKAPAARVFEALTTPDQVVKWWGRPGRFEVAQVDCDPRPGGAFVMRGISGGSRPFTVSGVYRTVERPRLLVLTWRPTWQGDATESLLRWELDEKDGVTRVRLTHSGLVTEASRASHRGWPQLLEGLRAYAEGEPIVSHLSLTQEDGMPETAMFDTWSTMSMPSWLGTRRISALRCISVPHPHSRM